MLKPISTEAFPPGGKLAELRAKTDRDLAALLRRELEQGFRHATQGEYAEAEAAYARIAGLLPFLRALRPQEFNSLQIGLDELRAHLEEVAFACDRLAS